MAKEPKTLNKENPLLRALSRWENEGGRTDAEVLGSGGHQPLE
ncbi:MAG: hypothetical protein FD172_2664 [Methylocystaceae bacterium]|nr:MAG: hypothetical protein FD172_2664 [Methylocystaceae bacterium]